MKSRLVCILLIVASCQTHAATVDQLVKVCVAHDAISWLACSTYVNGVFETLRGLTVQGVLRTDHAQGAFAICPPENIAKGDIRAIAVSYLRKVSSEHPESVDQSAALLIAVALHDAFPCNE